MAPRFFPSSATSNDKHSAYWRFLKSISTLIGTGKAGRDPLGQGSFRASFWRFVGQGPRRLPPHALASFRPRLDVQQAEALLEPLDLGFGFPQMRLEQLLQLLGAAAFTILGSIDGSLVSGSTSGFSSRLIRTTTTNAVGNQ
jgi:hypothetical protein